MSFRHRSWPLIVVIVALAFAFLPLARTYSAKYKLTLRSELSIYTAFLVLLALALAPAFLSLRLSLFSLLVCVPYLLYGAGTGDFAPLALLRLLVTPVTLLAIYAARPISAMERFCLQDFLAACLLIAVVLSGFLRGIWNIPTNLDFMSRLFLIAVAASIWTYVRPVPNLGYDLRVSWRILLQAALNFTLFALIALPLGLALHFIRWNPHFRGPLPFASDFLGIFLFVALLEEPFFRGFLQSLLSATWRTERLGQFAVACLFGLFHILHAPFPNWKYVGLATIAGWFYGSAFRKTGSLTASVLVHAAVDTTWRTWFSAH